MIECINDNKQYKTCETIWKGILFVCLVHSCSKYVFSEVFRCFRRRIDSYSSYTNYVNRVRDDLNELIMHNDETWDRTYVVLEDLSK